MPTCHACRTTMPLWPPCAPAWATQHVARGAAVHHAGALVACLEAIDQEADEDLVPLGRLALEAADVIAGTHLQAARDQSVLRTVSAAWPMFRSLA